MTNQGNASDRRATPDFMINAMQTGDMMRALCELFKNATDAGATSIRMATADKSKFTIIDNGWGMDAVRQAAFLKAGFSTNNGSGKFGSGSSMFPFSFHCTVTVRTVSKNDPRSVYTCKFTYRQQAEYWLREYDIKWTKTAKNARSWPHSHPTGTELTYEFENPGMSGIFRSAMLRQRLTARLGIGIVESDMFMVDGQRLAPKEYTEATHPFVIEFDDKKGIMGGPVRLEFYRPVKSRAGHVRPGYDFWMGDGCISEVSFRNEVYTKLVETRDKVPRILMLKDVCGQVIAGFLKEYAMNNRGEYKGLDADERTLYLFKLINSKEAEIAKALNLQLDNASPDEAVPGKEEITALLSRINDSYNQPNRPPTGGNDKTGGRGKRGKSTNNKDKRPYFELNQPEFENGDVIVATLNVPGGSPLDYDIYDGDARAKTFELNRDEGIIKLRANSQGMAKLIARHKATGAQVEVSYEILPERWFRLDGPKEARLHERVTITALNTDKVLGEDDRLEWTIRRGEGQLLPGTQPNTQVFIPSKLLPVEINAMPSGDPDAIEGHTLMVISALDGGSKAFCIRGNFFDIQFDGRVEVAEYNKPVTINKALSGVHRMTFTPAHPFYRLALQQSTLSRDLIIFIAHEYAHHFYEEEDDAFGDSVRHLRVSELAGEIAAEMRAA